MATDAHRGGGGIRGTTARHLTDPLRPARRSFHVRAGRAVQHLRWVDPRRRARGAWQRCGRQADGLTAYPLHLVWRRRP
jgi:hypothetical protein